MKVGEIKEKTALFFYVVAVMVKEVLKKIDTAYLMLYRTI